MDTIVAMMHGVVVTVHGVADVGHGSGVVVTVDPNTAAVAEEALSGVSRAPALAKASIRVATQGVVVDVLIRIGHGFLEVEKHGAGVVVMVVSIETDGVAVTIEPGDPTDCANTTRAPKIANSPHGLAIVGHGSGVVVIVERTNGQGVDKKPEAHGVVVSVRNDAATATTHTSSRSMGRLACCCKRPN